MKVLGITPENIGKIAIEKGIPTILEYFTENLTKKILQKYGFAKIQFVATISVLLVNFK